jgi:RNA polymerase sigma factor (sigma-70 family)
MTLAAETCDDAGLVALCLKGDREAFGELVARHQSTVCALAYSSCGDMAHSQDLAQETFLVAWRKLGGLKDAARFRPWLLGIARNLAANRCRRNTRNPLAGAELLDDDLASAAGNPAGQAISKEEEGILWHSLARIPEAYREPLILYYREHQSIERVAATLELSEAAARQRLSRGRKLLQEQVLAFVAGALGRTNPGSAFTLGVLAALPAMTISAKAATFGAAVKGGLAVKGVGMVGVAAACLAPLFAFWRMWMDYRLRKQAGGSRRLLGLLRVYYIGITVSVVVMVGLVTLFMSFGQTLLKAHPTLFAGSMAGLILGYFLAIGRLARWFFRSVKQLPAEPLAERLGPGTSRGWEYRSRFELLGLPFIHLRSGGWLGRARPEQPRKIVKAWIAADDGFAVGVLFAYGAVAVAPITIGACSLGLLSYGAMAIGVLSFGGFGFGVWAFGPFAFGWQAFGDCAIAWNAACGGQYAVAHDYARAAAASAAQANNQIVDQMFWSNPFFRFCGRFLRPYGFWLIWLWVIPMMVSSVLQGGVAVRHRAALKKADEARDAKPS